MPSKSDNILRGRPNGETYEVNGSNHKLQFVKIREDIYEDLNKEKIYTSAHSILKQHKLEHSGSESGVSSNPHFISVTSGLLKGKKLSDII
jgi:hypothetical protein